MEAFHCKLYIEKSGQGPGQVVGVGARQIEEEVLSDGWEPELLNN